MMKDANDDELPRKSSNAENMPARNSESSAEGNTLIPPLPSSTLAAVPSPPPTRSRLKLTYSIGIWLVLLLIVVVVFSPARDIVLNHFLAPTPTPVPTLIPGDDLFRFQATPQGHIYIDGQLLPRPQFGSMKPLQLTRGQHLITWKSDPFKSLSCVVDVPSQPASLGCPYESVDSLNTGTNIRLITFTASLADLPDTLHTALKQEIQAALDRLQSSDTVQAGEQYLHGSTAGAASAAPATQPLNATLRFHLDADPHSSRSCVDGYGDQCTFNGQNCLQLCTFPFSGAPSSPGSKPSGTINWSVVALFYPTWTYSAGNGQVIAQDQPDGIGVGIDHSILLHVTWDSKSWHVSIDAQNGGSRFSVDPSCASINNEINSTTTYGISQGANKVNVDWNLYAGTKRAAGCLGVVFPSPISSPTPTAAQPRPAYFLYRFGVLLAANALAHSYFPALPVADAYEQAIAQSIAVQNHT